MAGPGCPSCGQETYRFLNAHDGQRVCNGCYGKQEANMERLQRMLQSPHLARGTRVRLRQILKGQGRRSGFPGPSVNWGRGGGV